MLTDDERRRVLGALPKVAAALSRIPPRPLPEVPEVPEVPDVLDVPDPQRRSAP